MMTDEELAVLRRRIAFGRPTPVAGIKDPVGGVVYPDEADAILPELVDDLIAARAEIERLREILEDPEKPYP